MFVNVTSLTGISSWARGSGLEIVLLVTGTILLTRLATWAGARITGRIDASAQETDTLVRSEASKHRHALAQVITWTTLVVIYTAAGVLIAARLGIPVTSLAAPAAVVAVALGLGAQRIVQDILAGFFIITALSVAFARNREFPSSKRQAASIVRANDAVVGKGVMRRGSSGDRQCRRDHGHRQHDQRHEPPNHNPGSHDQHLQPDSARPEHNRTAPRRK